MVRLNDDFDFSPAGWKVHGPNERTTLREPRPLEITFRVDARTAARLERHLAMLGRLAPGGAWDIDRAALNLMMSALERIESVGPPAA